MCRKLIKGVFDIADRIISCVGRVAERVGGGGVGVCGAVCACVCARFSPALL